MSKVWAGMVVGVSGEAGPLRDAIRRVLMRLGAQVVEVEGARHGDLARTLATLPRLDGWVHCPQLDEAETAGGGSAAIGTTIGLVVDDAYRVCHLVGQRMLSQDSGAIVLLARVNAFVVGSDDVAGATLQAALVQMAKALGVSWAAHGIRVNVVAVGAIEGVVEADQREALQLRTPLGRLGLPEEVAEAVCFLLGEDSSFITAECLRVDGGWLAYQYFYPAVRTQGFHPAGEP